MSKNNVLNFYENLLEHNFLPYWSKFVDDEYGGLLNCINNYGDKLITLSTCDNSEQDGRFVVVAKKIN